MTNEELKAKIESIKSFEDAYKLACEGGYQGTADEFATLVENAADEIMPMDLDAMENVAGGGVGAFISDSWDSVTSACGKAANWVKENPVLTAEIAGGVAMVGVAIGTSVVAYKSYKTYQKNVALRGGYNQKEFPIGKCDLIGKCEGWQYIYDATPDCFDKIFDSEGGVGGDL